MTDAEVIILPVVRIEREGGVAPGLPFDRANTVDLNAFRYARERRAVERREMQSLLEETVEGPREDAQ